MGTISGQSYKWSRYYDSLIINKICQSKQTGWWLAYQSSLKSCHYCHLNAHGFVTERPEVQMAVDSEQFGFCNNWSCNKLDKNINITPN